MRFLETEDSFERNLMASIADETLKLQDEIGNNRAVQTANAVGKMLSKGT